MNEGTQIEQLLALEAAEQASWSTDIPSWHPRNENPGGAPAGLEGQPAGGGEGQPAGEGEPAAPAAPAVDFSPLEQRFGQLSEDLRSQFEAITDRLLEPPAPEPPDPFEGLDFSRLGGEVDPEDARALLGQMVTQAASAQTQQAIDQLRQQVIDPLMQQVQGMNTRSVAMEVQERNPELATDEGADAAMRAAADVALQLGVDQNTAIALARNPVFIEQVYRASQAGQPGGGQQPGGEPGDGGQQPDPSMLTPGGGAPAGGEGADDPAKRIVAAGQRSTGWW